MAQDGTVQWPEEAHETLQEKHLLQGKFESLQTRADGLRSMTDFLLFVFSSSLVVIP